MMSSSHCTITYTIRSIQCYSFLRTLPSIRSTRHTPDIRCNCRNNLSNWYNLSYNPQSNSYINSHNCWNKYSGNLRYIRCTHQYNRLSRKTNRKSFHSYRIQCTRCIPLCSHSPHILQYMWMSILCRSDHTLCTQSILRYNH